MATDDLVVVVGGGMAGLVAAISAAEGGCRVLLVEKGTRMGGSMFLSNGDIWSYATCTQFDEISRGGDADLQHLIINRLPDSWDWLAERGVAVSPPDVVWRIGHRRKTDPTQMTHALIGTAKKLGVDIRYPLSMTGLLFDGAVIGVVLESAGIRSEVLAKSVVLATGGFQGNPFLVQSLISPYSDQMYARSNPWSTGDGFVAALSAGAAVSAGLGSFYGHALPAPPLAASGRSLLEMTQRYGPLSVALNIFGKRFVDESSSDGEEVLNQEIARQPDATAVYIVDSTICRLSVGVDDLPSAITSIERAAAVSDSVVVGDSLEDLCMKLGAWGIPANSALRTLQLYNANSSGERIDLLWPPRQRNHFPISTPPIYAVRVRPGITLSGGGLQVDSSMAVMSRSSTVGTLPLLMAGRDEIVGGNIEGMFAAGADVGNINGIHYIGGLATALVTGRVSGASAAA